MNKRKVLVVDDDLGGREALRMILKDTYEVISAENGTAALKAFGDQKVDTVILDIVMPDIDGIEVLRRMKEEDSLIPVIMVTATQSVKTAVDAMKLGAYDYITKPYDMNEIKLVVEKAMQNQAMMNELTYLRSEVKKTYGFENIIGNSAPMRVVFEVIQKVKDTDSTVLIMGESGTGKELIARAVHFSGVRKDKPFIAVHCAAIPSTLLESELFGHERGAFTGADQRKLGKFELADTGTIFLDEIGEMDPAIQAKMLRVLQEQEINRVGGTKPIKIDVRILAATNLDLKKAVQEGKFREDLYYRINVVPILVPPLRERKEDIPALANFFFDKYKRELHSKVQGISPEAVEAFEEYHWPGNVRELENLMERLLTLVNHPSIRPEDLQLSSRGEGREAPPSSSPLTPVGDNVKLEEATASFEKEIILGALEKSNWIASQAARRLGTTRRILKYRMDQLGIKKEMVSEKDSTNDLKSSS